MLLASTTFSQHKLKTFRGSGHAKNKWIKHIQQNQLCYAEKSPTAKAAWPLKMEYFKWITWYRCNHGHTYAIQIWISQPIYVPIDHLFPMSVHEHWPWLVSINFILRFLFCVSYFVLFFARPHDCRKYQIQIPVIFNATGVQILRLLLS